MAIPDGFSPFIEEGRLTKKTISGSGATRTLSVDESGSTVLFDRAAGIVYTLPLAKPGVYFDFFVTTSITSGSAKIITAAATEILAGGVTLKDGTVATVFAADNSTHRAITQNGSTTGGLVGSNVRVTCVSNTRWVVDNSLLLGSGTGATPFATS